MQPHMLYAAVMGAGMLLGSAAVAADPPKEGRYSYTYSGAGSYKATAVGKERLLLAWDENGLSVGNGLFDRMTWHCWGTGDAANGVGHFRGYCVGDRPRGRSRRSRYRF